MDRKQSKLVVLGQMKQDFEIWHINIYGSTPKLEEFEVHSQLKLISQFLNKEIRSKRSFLTAMDDYNSRIKK